VDEELRTLPELLFFSQLIYLHFLVKRHKYNYLILVTLILVALWQQLSCWTHCLVYSYFLGFLCHWCSVHFNCMRVLHEMTIQSHLPWRAALYKGKFHDLRRYWPACLDKLIILFPETWLILVFIFFLLLKFITEMRSAHMIRYICVYFIIPVAWIVNINWTCI
jgi:hypothetical protein